MICDLLYENLSISQSIKNIQSPYTVAVSNCHIHGPGEKLTNIEPMKSCRAHSALKEAPADQLCLYTGLKSVLAGFCHEIHTRFSHPNWP